MHSAAAITDFLFLGSYAAITKDKCLEKHGIKFIVNGLQYTSHLTPFKSCDFLGYKTVILMIKLLTSFMNSYIIATVEIPDCNLPGVETFRVKITDSPASKIGEHFDEVSDFIGKLSICVTYWGGLVVVHQSLNFT